MGKDKAWEKSEDIEQIKEELYLLARAIRENIPYTASMLWQDGLAMFEGYDNGYKYIINRVKTHDWQKEMAKELVEQEDLND